MCKVGHPIAVCWQYCNNSRPTYRTKAALIRSENDTLPLFTVVAKEFVLEGRCRGLTTESFANESSYCSLTSRMCMYWTERRQWEMSGVNDRMPAWSIASSRQHQNAECDKESLRCRSCCYTLNRLYSFHIYNWYTTGVQPGLGWHGGSWGGEGRGREGL